MHPKSLTRLIAILCLAATTSLVSAAPGDATDNARPERGGRANWDPAQFQQRMMSRLQEQLKIEDAEWKVIEPRFIALYEKQRGERELEGNRMRRRPGAEREVHPAVKAVEDAIAANDAAAVKSSLDALRQARKAAAAETEAARAAVREVLTVAQEAQLVLMGTLD